MYIPNADRVEDRQQLLAFMRAHSFATVISHVEEALFASHVPLTITKTGTETGAEIVLTGHLAKANRQWQELATQTEVLVIFQGPHAYISPRHYAKWESVPTWNYIAVHAYGSAQLVTDEAGKLAALSGLIAATEAGYQQQWDTLPETFQQGLLNGIVAFEIQVQRLEGKYKLSRNRPTGDQERVAAALVHHPDSAAQAVGSTMQRMMQD
ncbi:MAG: FMN-binding negative transcriptional regulator [Caldilineaceae bacterium]|nr:FMN-binding negative transcriptional regulator [Caldilineaceae bacterium]